MKKSLTILILSAFYFSATSQPISNVKVNYNTAFEIAIADFLKCGLCKKHNAFYVSVSDRNEHGRYKISTDILTISIFPTETKNRIMPFYYITQADSVGSKRLPTKHIIKNGKLFYWHDSEYGLTEEMIKVFMDYNIADSLENSEVDHILGQEWQSIDEKTKGADYYFCKDNLKNYKRVITNIGIGGYKPPKLKCKHRYGL